MSWANTTSVRHLLAVAGVVLGTATATAQSLSESWRNNLRATIDSSVDVVSRPDGTTLLGTVGFDVHKVLSGGGGDWATVVLQGYATGTEPIATGLGNDLSFMYRIFNVNFTRFGHGLFNVRVGHFEIPFGLEHVHNTNGTLRDYMHGHNIGIKADWGVSVNGSWPRGEYEVAWSRGTETSLSATNGSYVVSGRVGTPSDGNVVVGASFLQGTIVDAASAAGVVDRSRIGADVAWYRGVHGVLAETAYGVDADVVSGVRAGVSNSLVEVNRADRDGRVTTYLQARLFSRETPEDWKREFSAALGVRHALSNHWSISAEYAHAGPTQDGHGRTMRAQLRHRF